MNANDTGRAFETFFVLGELINEDGKWLWLGIFRGKLCELLDYYFMGWEWFLNFLEVLKS